MSLYNATQTAGQAGSAAVGALFQLVEQTLIGLFGNGYLDLIILGVAVAVVIYVWHSAQKGKVPFIHN